MIFRHHSKQICGKIDSKMQDYKKKRKSGIITTPDFLVMERESFIACQNDIEMRKAAIHYHYDHGFPRMKNGNQRMAGMRITFSGAGMSTHYPCLA